MSDRMKVYLSKNKDIAVRLLYAMKRIRFVEEEIARRYSGWKMRCPVHLCTGQEAVAAAVGEALRKDDFVVSTHRGHGHYLAKGGNLKRMIAEIYGKAAGCSRGKGGSMHLIDRDVNFMGSTAIVGGTIPIGVGLGLSARLKESDQLSCVFLGDGAVEEGVFYESLNFAVLKNLPVLFICENNLYSVYSPLSVRQPEGRKIYEMVKAIGCPAEEADGNMALEAYARVEKAVSSVRSGDGPYFIEFKTYRWREHCGHNLDNDLGYRTQQEYAEWKERDPVILLESFMLKKSLVSRKEIMRMDKGIVGEVEEAFVFAEESSFPGSREALRGIYE